MMRQTILTLMIGLSLAGTGLTQPRYHVTGLGTMTTTDVNDASQVLGRVGSRPVMWMGGAITPMQDLGFYGGNPLRWGEAGHAVGYISYPDTGFGGAAQWDASGTLTILAQNPLHGSWALAQNAAGVTAGIHGRLDSTYPHGPVSSAARWETPDALTLLPTRDGQWSTAIGVDGAGNVWGHFFDGVSAKTLAVYWGPAQVRHVIPGDLWQFTSFVAVSESGLGVGQTNVGTPPLVNIYAPVQATIAEGFSLLPELEGGDCSPVDVNRDGMIIGSCYMAATDTDTPVAWQDGTVHTLPLPVPPEVQNFRVTGLSNSGLIVGYGLVVVGTDAYGYPIRQPRAFLFTPVPDGGSVVCQCGDTVASDYTLPDHLRCDLQGTDAALVMASGVKVQGSGHWLIGSGGGTGLLFDGTQGSEVANLHVTGFANGVKMRAGASGNYYHSSWVWGHAGHGVWLDQGSQGNWVWLVNSLLNGGAGVSLSQSSQNTIGYVAAWSNGASLDMRGANRHTFWANTWYGDAGDAARLSDSHLNAFYFDAFHCARGHAIVLQNSDDNHVHGVAVRCPVRREEALATTHQIAPGSTIVTR
jgi:hypothetical protein